MPCMNLVKQKDKRCPSLLCALLQLHVVGCLTLSSEQKPCAPYLSLALETFLLCTAVRLVACGMWFDLFIVLSASPILLDDWLTKI